MTEEVITPPRNGYSVNRKTGNTLHTLSHIGKHEIEYNGASRVDMPVIYSATSRFTCGKCGHQKCTCSGFSAQAYARMPVDLRADFDRFDNAQVSSFTGNYVTPRHATQFNTNIRKHQQNAAQVHMRYSQVFE